MNLQHPRPAPFHSPPAARCLWALWATAMIAVLPVCRAWEPPHDLVCNQCHLNHTEFGNQRQSLAGNANLCLSCHIKGGTASAKPLSELDQAVPPGSGASSNVIAYGSSHRWDANPSGHTVVYLGPSSGNELGGVTAAGAYTGHYEKTYTITITASGNAQSARFDWVASPAGNGATNVLAADRVPLEDGLQIAFQNYRPAPAFTAGQRWQIHVRPDLTPPTDPELLATMSGAKVVCSTCHNQHSQEKTPFDPAAHDYFEFEPGHNRHFMRLDNNQDQLCRECHGPRFVTNALAGSHPIGVGVLSNAFYRPPASLPLDRDQQQMWCSTCHQMHYSPSNDGRLLRTKDQSALCTQCHKTTENPSPALHLTPLPGTLWPGGQYGSLRPAASDPAQRGSCGNCHQVHGWPDAANPTNDYPQLLVEREENLCYTCHDGSPVVKNLRTNFTKTYAHPVALTARHTAREANTPASYGGSNRHAECVDCHNPHALSADGTAPAAPAAPGSLNGVARVSVTNLNSNTVSFTFRGPSDPAPAKEYELCFLCHSSWTTQPAGQADYAAKFNDRNASFHPVEALGKNANINPNAFVNGWTGTRMMYCSDCHTSDDLSIRGPHASTNRYILKQPYVASSSRRTMSRGELCFDCHRYDTYANGSASATVKNYSRFNTSWWLMVESEFGGGHTYHVGTQRLPCYTCHETHGSSNQPFLIATGRNPGIISYTKTATGGSCTATCHWQASYTVTYPR